MESKKKYNKLVNITKMKHLTEQKLVVTSEGGAI